MFPPQALKQRSEAKSALVGSTKPRNRHTFTEKISRQKKEKRKKKTQVMRTTQQQRRWLNWAHTGAANCSNKTKQKKQTAFVWQLCIKHSKPATQQMLVPLQGVNPISMICCYVIMQSDCKSDALSALLRSLACLSLHAIRRLLSIAAANGKSPARSRSHSQLRAASTDLGTLQCYNWIKKQFH